MTVIQRPAIITVCCILSWIWIGFSLIANTSGMTEGPLSPEEIEAAKSAVLAIYSDEQVQQLKPLLEQMFVMMDTMNSHFWTIRIIDLIVLLIGLQGVIMMFRMKKMGYYLYSAYTIAPIIMAVVFYPGVIMGVALVFFIVFGGLFMILYATKLKEMK